MRHPFISLLVITSLIAGGYLLGPLAWATNVSPYWEAHYGQELGDLTGKDDESTEFSLSFSFPFNGQTYTSIWINTNGLIGLGDMLDLEPFPRPDDLIDAGHPIIAPFWTDLDLFVTGAIYAVDSGHKVTVTWHEVGAWSWPEAPFTFQVQLHSDGSIIFSYNGISPIGAYLPEHDVLVGVIDQGGKKIPSQQDFGAGASRVDSTTVYLLFGEDSPFELDGMSVFWEPTELSDGFYVSPKSNQEPNDELPQMPISSLGLILALVFLGWFGIRQVGRGQITGRYGGI